MGRAQQAPAATPQGVVLADNKATEGQLQPAKEDQKAGPAAATGVVLVKTRQGVVRFCRAGMCFGQEPTELAVDGLAAGVLEQLMAEPNLQVSQVQTGD